jgi:hypothetical protein
MAERITVTMGLKQERGFLPPFQGFKIMWVIDPGRRSCSRLRTLRRGKRFALGYFLSGFHWRKFTPFTSNIRV